jgi:hypothetical protein
VRADPAECVLPELLSRGPGKERREGQQRVAFAARCSQFFSVGEWVTASEHSCFVTFVFRRDGGWRDGAGATCRKQDLSGPTSR